MTEPGTPTATQVEQLVRFLGYGTLAGNLWMIGFEEGLGGRARSPGWSPEWEVDLRSRWQPVMDARQAHRQLKDHYWERRDYSGVWRMAAKLARGILTRAGDWLDTDRAHEYVISELGRSHGDTFLGDLLPLPAKDLGHWPYSSVFKDRRSYEASVRHQRIAEWGRLIRQEAPLAVCCYGQGNRGAQWDHYRALAPGASWHQLRRGRVERAIQGQTSIYLLPFLGNGRCKEEMDLGAVVEDLRAAVTAAPS